MGVDPNCLNGSASRGTPVMVAGGLVVLLLHAISRIFMPWVFDRL